jgi:UDP-N-acetylglucosamine--N-acetylmuramyl-(pentapeptide) pyrophosphoryl-undecaprenol N-acetylglucosamine transferase
LVVLEVNLLPGKAIRLLARWADVVVTGYPETAGYLPERARARVRCLGVPVRPEFCAVPESGEARRLLGLDAEQPVVAVLGGSLGAQRLNSVAERLLPAVARGAFQLVWQYGERFAVPSELPPGVVARPFYDEPALVLAAADCVVSRAGGMTIAELCCVGRASVLVPYPAATEQHQLANARWMEQWGAAICITDDRAEAEVPHIVERLVHDGEYRQRMAAAARRLAHPDAARRIAELVWQL